MRFLIAAAALPMIAFASPAAAQDAEAGKRVFNQCRACHMVGENARHTVGPQLNGVFGREAGKIEGYNFSNVFKEADWVWDEENFAEYIRNPREVTPGTRMVYAGLKDDQQIADLTAYLMQFNEDGTTD